MHITKLIRGVAKVIALIAALLLGAAANTALAAVSAEFSTGAIAEYSGPANQNDNSTDFASLGISKIVMSQNGSQWGGSQGNDTSVTLTIYYSGGGTYSFTGALNWQLNDGGAAIPVQYFGVTTATPIDDTLDLYPRTSPSLSKTYILVLPSKVTSSNFASRVTNDQTDGSANFNDAAIFQALTGEFPPADPAPVITGPTGGAGAATSALSVNENQTGVTTLTSNEPVAWSITGGQDGAKFAIDPSTGVLTFVAAPDYEVPTDGSTSGSNTYIVEVRAQDSGGNFSTQTVTVTVLNLDDAAPLITGPSGGAGAATSAITINEGQTAVTTFTANEAVTWFIDGGSDALRFTINPTTGAIVFQTAPDYENSTDSDRNNTYFVRIKAVDAFGNISYQTLTVTITNVDEIGRKLSQIGDRLRTGLRTYAAHSLSDMLSFNESLVSGGGKDDGCNDPKAHKQLSGLVNANEAGGDINLNYAKRLSECGRGDQVLVNVGMTYSKLGGNWNSRLFSSLRYETRIDKDLTLGIGAIASRANDSITGFDNSMISDKSLQINLYGRYRLSEKLRTAAFVGLGRAWYDFGLSESDGFLLNGKMTGGRHIYGWMLSGEYAIGNTVLTTDAIMSRAVEKLGSARLAAQYLGENRSGLVFAVGTVDVTRISIPVTAPITLSGGEEGFGSWSRLLLSPGLLCEDNDVDSSTLLCGYQLGAKLAANDSSGRNRFYVDYHWERVNGMKRSLIGLGYAYRFGKDSGFELAFDVNRGLNGGSGQDNRARVSLRLVN